VVMGNHHFSRIVHNKFSVCIHIPDTGRDSVFNGSCISIVSNVGSTREPLQKQRLRIHNKPDIIYCSCN
jgi:hypothetical protein